MKQLTLIRHAQAAQDLSDITRPLSKVGILQARWLGTRLREKEFSFDKMFSSNATRTLDTAKYICSKLGFSESCIEADIALYNVDIDNLYNYISMIDDNVMHAVIVGHNPSIQWLVQDLTCKVLDNVAPCTLLNMKLNVECWSAIGSGCGELIDWFPTPEF